MIIKKLLRPALFALLCALPGTAACAAESAGEAVAEAASETWTESGDAAENAGWKLFVVEDPETYVTLGAYKGLDVEKAMYTVSDEDVDTEIEDRLYATSSLEATGKPAKEGDTITMDLTAAAGTDETSEEDFAIDLGYELLGPEFDEKLTGCEPGSALSFTISYGEDFEIPDFAGKDVTFDVKVTGVEHLVEPELNDAWVRSHTDQEDVESYREAVREELQVRADEESTDAAAEAAFQAAMDQAQFSGYPQELYDAVHAQVGSQYEMMASLFGISVEELYESYGMTEEDLEKDTVSEVNSFLLLSALAKAEGLEDVSEEDISAFVDHTYASYGYDSAEDMTADADYDDLVLAALQYKVRHFILDNSNVTETEYDYSESDLIFDDSAALDLYTEEDVSADGGSLE